MFGFLNVLKSQKKVEQKIQKIQQQGLNLDHTFVQKGKSTEIGAYYGNKGSIKVDSFMAESTRFLSTDLYEIEHKQAVEKYRYISLLPEADDAIEEIVNESIVMGENDTEPVTISFGKNNLPLEIRSKIIKEFDYIRDVLLEFSEKGHFYFRNWYIDGTIIFEKVFDEDNIREGIQKLNMLDPRFTTYYTVYNDINTIEGKAKELVDEFFVLKQPLFSNRYYRTEGMYSYPSSTNQSEGLFEIKIPKELITYCDSGLYHPSREYPVSYLHKALKVANQLTMLEDALLVYRITRAPERRIFFIEVGNLPTSAAEAHIQEVMRNYRQEKIYDVNSGTIKDKNAVFSMTEDFWLPRRNGSSSTEVTTLPGGQNLDQVADLDYFARKIWRSLSVPYARRADKENTGVQYSSGKELSLEELKFYKFILKLRRQFSKVFKDLLETQLLVKRIIDPENLLEVMSKIKFSFNNSNFFNEYLKMEVLESKLNVVNTIDQFVGKYVSQHFVWKEIFNFTDEQILEEITRMKKEKQGDFIGMGTFVKGDKNAEAGTATENNPDAENQNNENPDMNPMGNEENNMEIPEVPIGGVENG